ncbi:MAG: ArgE/DapE family deacylase [Kiritimatiellae bacterium]|nr:ArgE/DapE family deacylase [Kiritimatiellia bacterium]
MCDFELITLLKKLVSIPSVNPEDTDDSDITGEQRIAEFLADYLEQKEFQVQWMEQEPGRPNIIASFGSESASRTLLLESHLDTVSVHGMKRPPFTPQIEEGRLYGRGACDTKGPMAAVLHALEPSLLRKLSEGDCRIIFVGAMGEEKGNQGAAYLAGQGIGADEAIILEPTECSIVHAHKGALWFRVEVVGVAGHGSDPARGVNAIEALGQAVQKLKAQTELDRENYHSDILGQPTINFGVIKGGSAVNIVPDHCLMEVDRRYLPDEDVGILLENIKSIFSTLKKEDKIKGFEFHIIKDSIPFLTSTTSPLVNRLQRSCKEVGVEATFQGSSWYSDAGHFSQTCSDVVVLGPGSIKQAHTADEYIELESLQRGYEILTCFLSDWVDEMKDLNPSDKI